MNKAFYYCIGVFFLVYILSGCEVDEKRNLPKFDPDKPIIVSDFYPDSGGIATPIIINGDNFGSDTTGLEILFVDSLGVRHPAGIVGSNGNKIFAYVPKLTYLREMKIEVERTLDDGSTVQGRAERPFFYKTQTSVTTVIGRPEPDNNNVPTVGGDFSSATIGAPFAICLDDEGNIFIVERNFSGQNGVNGIQSPKDDKGDNVSSNLLLANTEDQEMLVLRYGTSHANAPAFSTEEGNEAVYIPEDAGLYYFQLLKSLSYSPRHRSLILDEDSRTVLESNWKYSFVVNEEDHMVYTVMYRGQLVRFNPVTRNIEVLLDNVLPDLPNARSGANGSNCYVIFSPTDPNMLYICMEDYNMISRVDIAALDDKDRSTYKGEFYAGNAMHAGAVGGHGWEDGLLENAKFAMPKQIAFTSDGKLYIADTGNHCIRVIDTTVPKDRATVSTAVGLPQNPGFQDGGPELAKFDRPTGVAVSSDGSEIYVADNGNHVIRKLSVE